MDMRIGMAGKVQRFFGRRGRTRESASYGAAALGVLLLAGAALGNGVARTAVDVSDGLTWLSDSPRGEVVQVNPASGRPETRLQVSGGNAALEITQKDGLLVVLDRRTGQITVIDLATLLASGRRQANPGPASKVLVSNGRIYVVDRTTGTVHNADPVTLADVGKAWEAGQPLADVVVDDDGVVWAVDHGGNLHALEWNDGESRFTERSDERIPGAGPSTVLVPHKNGVTLLGLDNGVVRQAGTGQDVSASTPQLSGEVLAAQTSPSGLVPAAVPGSGTVVIVAGDAVLRVNVAGLGCATPGRPVVFRDKVYVPCRGAGKVIVLDRSGNRGGPDVSAAGSGDPEVVTDDGHLFISAPGAERGTVVDADGSTRQVVIRSPELQVVNPDRPPIPEVPSPPPPSPRRPDPPRDNPRNSNNPQPPREEPPGPQVPGGGVPTSQTPASTAPPATTPPAVAAVPGAPPGITVTLASRTAANLSVTVSWGAAPANGAPVTGYAVTATGSFNGGNASATTSGTSVALTFPCAGSSFCDNGRLDVSVTATNSAGRGPAGTRPWNVPLQTTTPPPPPPTTQPPPPPPTTTTTTTPPPPPPAPVPTAGVTIIGTPQRVDQYTRTLPLTPPADWASHDGRCELVNLTHGYIDPVACSANSVTVPVEIGSNRVVLRAHARDDSRFVDSAARLFNVRSEEPTCGRVLCLNGNRLVELSPTDPVDPAGPAGAGLGFLALAVLLRIGIRRGGRT